MMNEIGEGDSRERHWREHPAERGMEREKDQEVTENGTEWCQDENGTENGTAHLFRTQNLMFLSRTEDP